jgi:2-polyprenyl-3-methyl-5-hydroxy-6-metoxy-1,4-benzoquinol methylase
MSEYLIPVGDKDVKRMSAMGLAFNEKSLKILNELENVKSLLDMGCGNGELLNLYAEQHPDCYCVGIDKSQEQLDIAKENNKITWCLGDAENFTDDRKYDVVHTRFLLTHLQKPIEVAEKLLDLVSDGGYLVLEEQKEVPIFEKTHRSLEAWKDAFILQHILQKSSLTTGVILKNHFENAQCFENVGCFNNSEKKYIVLAGVQIACEKLKQIKIPDKINPLITHNLTPEIWIKEAEEIVNKSNYEWNMISIILVIKKN